jgi:hypothetical protein
VGDQTGVQEVYVMGIGGSGLPTPISQGGGTDPRWSFDGSELFFRTESWIVSVGVRTSPGFEVTGAPDSLFAGPYLFNQSNNWDVHPDGRFVMIKGDPSTSRQLEIKMSRFRELNLDASNR